LAVPMTEQQEEVYGWLGLSPALLLEEPPESDNLLVRVVRPGEDADAVLEEARQQLAASSGRRRRRGSRGGSRGGGRSTAATDDNGSSDAVAETSTQADSAPLLVEITPLEITPFEPVAVVSAEPPAEPQAEPVPVAAGSDGSEDDQEPRRRRRRSSAASAD
jgi:ribonuclease E